MHTAGVDLHKSHAAIDVTKLIMAFLVVAIHTEPFGFSFWLDKSFGIITRLCVPFFFVASSYFFFLKDTQPLRYIKRLFQLYLVWSLVYLPFDLPELRAMTFPQILAKYFWIGNGHALWYLCGSIVGFLIVWGLSRIMSPKKVFALAVVFLVIGCLKSTYAPAVERLFSVTLPDYLGSRNGLFYAFTYYAMGLVIAKKKDDHSVPVVKNVVGFLISLLLLGVESLVFVWVFKTKDTVLWLSVLPLTYHFFLLIKGIQIPVSEEKSVFCRKLSTLIYVTHCFYMYLLPNLHYWGLFLVVSLISAAVAVLIVYLSPKRFFRWLKFIY